MDVNEKLSYLRKEKKHIIDKINFAERVLDRMRVNSKFEKANNYVRKKHNAYLQIDTLNNRIDEICESIEYYSYFDSEEIGPIICELITLFEGEQFIYQSANYYSSNKENKIECIKLIVLNDKKQENWYEERYVNSLVKKGNAIVLTKAETFYPHLDIYFYTADQLHRVNQNVSYGKFAYIKEFIDSVILYKMNTKMKFISAEELEKLKIDFIKSRINQIKNYNEFTDDRKVKEFMLSLEHDRNIRERRLQRILRK